MAYTEEVVKSTYRQTLSIYSFDFGGFRVVRSSRNGYKTKDFETYAEAKRYADKVANTIRY